MTGVQTGARTICNALNVANKAINNKMTVAINENVAVFDHDMNDSCFKKAVQKCIENNVIIAYTNVNFDLFLLLHKTSSVGMVTNTSGYVDKIRKAYNLGNEADIKNKDVIKKMLEQISLNDIIETLKRCKAIQDNAKENKQVIYTDKKGNKYYNQPSLSIHEFLLSKLKYLNILK